jgi:hypothetical protein
MLVLYHMVIADIEEAMILINYSSRKLIWYHNDSEGRCWFYRQANAKGPGIECWRDYLCQKTTTLGSCSGSRCCGAKMRF